MEVFAPNHECEVEVLLLDQQITCRLDQRLDRYWEELEHCWEEHLRLNCCRQLRDCLENVAPECEMEVLLLDQQKTCRLGRVDQRLDRFWGLGRVDQRLDRDWDLGRVDQRLDRDWEELEHCWEEHLRLNCCRQLRDCLENVAPEPEILRLGQSADEESEQQSGQQLRENRLGLRIRRQLATSLVVSLG
jgi:hypothetical protein